jgi:NTE family protein
MGGHDQAAVHPPIKTEGPIRALVLSGGGSKGAYHVGALRRLTELGKSYDLLCGVSVGALLVGQLAQFPKGEEEAALAAIQRLWYSLETKKIHKRWFWGYLASLWKSGVRNNEPLRDLVRDLLDIDKIVAAHRHYCIGGVSLTSGEYRIWTEAQPDLLPAALMESSAYPIAFPAERIGTEFSTDGGVRSVTPLASAIRRGATEIDVLLTQQRSVGTWDETNPNVLDVGLRVIDIMNSEIVENDLKVCGLYNMLVGDERAPDKRYIDLTVQRPTAPLGDSLDFEQENILPMMDRGYEDAVQVWG